MTQPSPTLGLVEVSVPEGPLLAIYGDGGSDRDAALLGFAHALATSLWWSDMEPATLVTRSSPRPTIGVIGRFDEATRRRLGWIQYEVDHVLPHTMVLTYADAEAATMALADRFLDRFERSELERSQFQAIPRGGHIVLGLLAYALQLSAEQLSAPAGPDRTSVVVDDCILTGRRIGETLARIDSSDIVIASLYASPAARAEIVHREPRVRDCLSARDLTDLAPERRSDDYEAWRSRWAERDGRDTYWHGLTEHVCFPWNEPDIAFWNPIHQRQELGWPLAPVRAWQQHRAAERTNPHIHVMAGSRGPYRAADRIYAGPVDGAFVVANGVTEQAWSLDPVAADMWNALTGADSWSEALAELENAYDVRSEVLEHDLRRLVDTLHERGLLSVEGGTAHSGR